MLQMESKPDTFRVLWVAGIALIRTVGHVLQKVDSKESSAVKTAVELIYYQWKSEKLNNTIFWDFIELERNQILKQYELGFFEGPVSILVKN